MEHDNSATQEISEGVRFAFAENCESYASPS